MSRLLVGSSVDWAEATTVRPAIGAVASAVSRPEQPDRRHGNSPRPDPIMRSTFAGFCFPPDVIVLAVRWYLRFGLSSRDVEELLTERGIEVDSVTVYR
jgi:hypothetical protein